MRAAGRDLLSLALMDARNHTLQLLTQQGPHRSSALLAKCFPAAVVAAATTEDELRAQWSHQELHAAILARRAELA